MTFGSATLLVRGRTFAPGCARPDGQLPDAQLKAEQRGGLSPSPQSPDTTRVEPGQLWLIEVPTEHSVLAPAQRRVLRAANVVVYDRALAGIVSSVLPLGGYAEAAEDSAAANRALGRCVQFARDGWSVVRVVAHADGEQTGVQRLRDWRRRLLSAGVDSQVPGESGTMANGAAAPALHDGASREPAPLPVLLAVLASDGPRFHQVSANGLAG